MEKRCGPPVSRLLTEQWKIILAAIHRHLKGHWRLVKPGPFNIDSSLINKGKLFKYSYRNVDICRFTSNAWPIPISG